MFVFGREYRRGEFGRSLSVGVYRPWESHGGDSIAPKCIVYPRTASMSLPKPAFAIQYPREGARRRWVGKQYTLV